VVVDFCRFVIELQNPFQVVIPMRILALTPSFYGWTGAAVNERQLITVLAKKVEKCYVVTFVSFKHFLAKRKKILKELEGLPENMTVIVLPLPKRITLAVCLGMIAVSCIVSIVGLMLRALRKVDLVYIRNSLLAIGFLTFSSLAKRTIVKIPAIIEDEILGRGFAELIFKWMTKFLDRLALAKAGKIAVNGFPMYFEIAKRRSYIRKDRPLMIPPGVNLHLIENIKRQVSAKQSTTINVGFLGLLEWWQGVDILARAVALLKKNVPNVKLVIIGDGSLRPLVEGICKAYNLQYEITGFLPHQEALKRAATLDVLAVPSKRFSTTESNIPIKVIEAWALSLPVVITKHKVFVINGILDGEHVVYCEPEPTSVAEALIRVLTNEDLKTRLKTNGPKLAMQFDYDKIAENILESLSRDES